MATGWEVFWQEVLVPYGIANGVLLRLHISPTKLLLNTVGQPSEPVLALVTVLNFIPLLVALGWSYQFGRGVGVLSFGAAAWTGYVIPENPDAAIFWILVTMGLAALGPIWKELRQEW